MKYEELGEFHFIAHQDNLSSIHQHGIVCKEEVRLRNHTSIALADVQEIRSKVRVPNGLKLHQYANLYFHARNPMMFVRRGIHENLAVLGIDRAVVCSPGAVVADANASSKWTGFWAAPDGLAKVNRELTFAEDWRDPDQITYWRKKSAKCAEVLVPGRVPPGSILRVYVSCDGARQRVRALGLPWPVEIDAHLFFQD